MEQVIIFWNATPFDLADAPAGGGPGKLMSDEDFVLSSTVISAIGMAIAVFGIFTNIVNISTFVRMGVEDGVTTLFLAISCSDLAYVVLTCVRNTTAIMYTMEEVYRVWLTAFNPVIIAYFADNAAFIMYTTTTLISTFLCVARCLCVAKPLHFKNMFSRGRCVVASVICFLYPLACQIAIFVNMGTTVRFYESRNASRLTLWMSSDRERVKNIVRLMANFILPIVTQVIAVVCVAIMIVKLREAVQFRTGQKTEHKDAEASATRLSGKERQVVKQVVVILLIFMAVNVQRIVDSVLNVGLPHYGHLEPYNNLYHTVGNLRAVFDSLNASVNIFVYFFYNSRFRTLSFSCK